MNLEELHERFSAYIQAVEKEVSLITNHNYIILENLEEGQKELKFKVASAFNILKHYRQIAIIFQELGEKEIFQIPELLVRYLNKEEFKNLRIRVVDPLDSSREYSGNNLLFTGRIFIECDILLCEKSILYNHLDNLNFSYNNIPLYISIRSTNDYMNLDKEKLKSIFLCHDYSDKDIVEQVNAKLSRKLINVWYDKFSIKPGDSLYDKLSEGLNECDNGLIFISKSFLKNEGWAKFELQSLINRQIYEKKKVIIPVWVDIDVNDLNRHPWLRDKLAIVYSNDLDFFIKEVERAII
jgi:hypothetical protein